MIRPPLVLAALLLAGPALAQHRHHAPPPAAAPAAAPPSLPGQDAFAAIQEVVALLLADPRTDWSRVNLEALRSHLLDMQEVTLHATATQEAVEGGFRARITGQGRTLDAIRRMVPAHAREMDGQRGWRIATEALPDGVLLTVTSTDAAQVPIIRGLGFIGVMTLGGHHQPHHLAMARGQGHGH